MDSCNEAERLSSMALLDRGQPQYCEEKYVTRTMKCLPDKFIELCHMHLAFLLDLSGDKLELLLSTQAEHKKKKSGLVSVGVFKKKDKPQAGLFGLPLTDEGVCLVIPLIKFLKMEKNVSKEGLFRKPGNKSRMTTLRDHLIAHGPAVSIDPEIYSPYDVACVLKEFLRELPEPLLTDRHMEAHRQVSSLGQHASAPEEAARYACRKLSALQLLMLLLPPPAQKLTMHLTHLLHRIAECPDTKMTSATLGTIFAPIFFIDRKVQASELCSQISQTAPAVSFMIEKAQDLFQAPKELVCDLAKYWCGLGQAPLHSQYNPQPSPMKKSLSGRTLHTNVCYIDRELSQCEDIASNTQAELASLFAHVQSLPSTPHNVRLKKHIMKAAVTPVLPGKRRRRSRSIGASIKKRLPSLGRSRNKQDDFSGTSTSSVCITDSKFVTPGGGDRPVHSMDTNSLQRPSRPRHKRSFTSENDNVAPSLICTPPKQICRKAEHLTPLTFTNDNEILSHKTANDENFIENKDPAILTTFPTILTTFPTILTTFPKSLEHDQIVSPIILTRGKDIFCQSDTSINYNPQTATQQIKASVTPSRDKDTATRMHHQQISESVTPSRDRDPATRLHHQQISASVTPNTDKQPSTRLHYQQISEPITPNRDKDPATRVHHQQSSATVTPNIDKEPATGVHHQQIGAFVTPSRDKDPATRKHPQRCRKPGTPIMPRAVLRLVQHNTPDSPF